jgi:hypothetical protein
MDLDNITYALTHMLPTGIGSGVMSIEGAQFSPFEEERNAVKKCCLEA